MKEITPGQKVKVYKTPTSKVIHYGEVMGVDIEGKLILAPRPDFSILKPHHFDLFRESKDVIFLTNETVYQSTYRFDYLRRC
jgi:predicted transcriptional regulator